MGNMERIARRIIEAGKGMNDIEDLVRAHQTRTWFDDGEGLVGVYNHRGVVLWYRHTPGGYSLVGETATPEGAQRRRIESST